jgi:hypothetical protein
VDVAETSAEAVDRSTLALPGFEDRLISAVAKVNAHTIVVIHSGGPVLMPWLSQVAAVVEAWYPGEEAGPALANLLTGAVNFSGRLPMTFPTLDQAAPMIGFGTWPAPPTTVNLSVLGGLDVGSSWYPVHHVSALFPFGFGLSYTTYSLTNFNATAARDGSVHANVTVTNTGTRPGRDVVQLYATSPRAAAEVPSRLVGFASSDLAAGASQVVSVTVPIDALEVWNTTFQLVPGTYRLRAASSLSDPGVSTTFIESPRPSAPDGVTATPGNASVSVTWNPSLGSMPADRYRALDPTSGAWCIAPASAHPGCTVRGLVNGVRYHFVVLAYRVSTVSVASGYSDAVVPEPAPSAPHALHATKTSGHWALSWSPSATLVSAPTYVVTVDGSVRCTTDSTTCSLGALARSPKHRAVVVARGPGGSSASSATSFTT